MKKLLIILLILSGISIAQTGTKTIVKFGVDKFAIADSAWDDLTTANYQRDFTKASGTFTIVTDGLTKYLNCSSTGNLYFTTRDNASNCYMTYDYYTGGAWTSKAGLVSALSTAEATMDYNATNRKLTFIMGTNDRVRNIKIIRGAIVQ